MRRCQPTIPVPRHPGSLVPHVPAKKAPAHRAHVFAPLFPITDDFVIPMDWAEIHQNLAVVRRLDPRENPAHQRIPIVYWVAVVALFVVWRRCDHGINWRERWQDFSAIP